MSTGIPSETAYTSPRRLFEQLNKKPLRDDLLFYFTIVIAVSILFMVVPFFTGPYPETEPGTGGLHWIVISGTIISLIQGLITGTIALLAISLVEHFFLLFVDVHREFEKTMKSVIYSLSPCILFSWAVVVVKAPYAGLLLLLAFCLITYLSVRVFHEMSEDRAVFVSLATSAVLAMYFSRWIFGPWLSP
ncbi:YIP1 family protein [Methanoculleus sp. UBA303]|jgi:hypothetical protein|uniref:YIP1 family protein n=1 Tax=Methanoculleus sp. UBA303 TaxID=1915497 RepID=UPI0025E05B10|nr:YIP1 family protein [Methanoculleus sp. UBA303]